MLQVEKHIVIPNQPLSIPNKVWSDISMDFIEGLPNSRGKSIIFAVVDCQSKYSHFTPISHPYSSPTVTQIFYNKIKLYRLSKLIICDSDPVFISIFWNELFYLQGINFNFTSSYYPQSDGKNKVLKLTIKIYLHGRVWDKPRECTKGNLIDKI